MRRQPAARDEDLGLASTLEAIAAAAGKGREVIVAGEVADIRFPRSSDLSLLAAKLFVQLLERAGADVVNSHEHRTSLESLNWAHQDLQNIEDAVDELHGTRGKSRSRRRRQGVDRQCRQGAILYRL